MKFTKQSPHNGHSHILVARLTRFSPSGLGVCCLRQWPGRPVRSLRLNCQHCALLGFFATTSANRHHACPCPPRFVQAASLADIRRLKAAKGTKDAPWGVTRRTGGSRAAPGGHAPHRGATRHTGVSRAASGAHPHIVTMARKKLYLRCYWLTHVAVSPTRCHDEPLFSKDEILYV